MAPERLASEDEERHAEDVVGLGLGLRLLIAARALRGDVAPIVGGGKAEAGDHAGDRVDMVDLQLTPEEGRVDLPAVVQDSALRLGEEPADQGRRAVVNLERALQHDAAALVRPAPRVEIGILHLVFRIDAPLALALEAKLEGDPAQAYAISIGEREGRLESQVGVRTLVVRIHLDLLEIA